jgi:hypothetical protein
VRPASLLLLSSCKHEAQHAHMRHCVCWGPMLRPQEATGQSTGDVLSKGVLQAKAQHSTLIRCGPVTLLANHKMLLNHLAIPDQAPL